MASEGPPVRRPYAFARNRFRDKRTGLPEEKSRVLQSTHNETLSTTVAVLEEKPRVRYSTHNETLSKTIVLTQKKNPVNNKNSPI